LQLRVIGKDDHARALVPEWQAAVVIRGRRFAWLDVHGACNRVGEKILWSAGVDKDGSVVTIKDVGEAVEIGLHGVAQCPPHRQAELISEKTGILDITHGVLPGGHGALRSSAMQCSADAL
jgi:hypothetical protein